MSTILTKIVSNIDFAVVEIISTIKNSVLYSIDCEYDSNQSNGCTLIQIAILNTNNNIDVTEDIINYSKIFILDRKCYRNVTVYIFNTINLKTLPKSLTNLLENYIYIKIGCGLSSDQRRLNYYNIKLSNCIDIQHIAATLGFQRYSLRHLSKHFGDLEKLKGKYTASDINTSNYINYAAYDAYITLECYLQMINYDNQYRKEVDIIPNLDQFYNFGKWLLTLNKNCTINELCIMSLSNYGDLQEYTREQKISIIKKIIKLLVCTNQISLNGDIVILKNTQYEIKSDISTNISSIKYTLTEEDINDAYTKTNITIPTTGIKYKSYVNVIANNNWHNLIPEARVELAERVVKALLDKKIFRKIGEKLFI